MNVGIGLKCPQGHFKVQTMIGDPICPICGNRLVPNREAPDVALNRYCKHCSTFIALNLVDTGHCPKCGRPWE